MPSSLFNKPALKSTILGFVSPSPSFLYPHPASPPSPPASSPSPVSRRTTHHTIAQASPVVEHQSPISSLFEGSGRCTSNDSLLFSSSCTLPRGSRLLLTFPSNPHRFVFNRGVATCTGVLDRVGSGVASEFIAVMASGFCGVVYSSLSLPTFTLPFSSK